MRISGGLPRPSAELLAPTTRWMVRVFSFERPDAYTRAGGLASRVEGLSETLAALGRHSPMGRSLAW